MAGEFTTSDCSRTATLAAPEHLQPLLPALFCLRSVVASRVSVTVLVDLPRLAVVSGGRMPSRAKVRVVVVDPELEQWSKGTLLSCSPVFWHQMAPKAPKNTSQHTKKGEFKDKHRA